MEEPNHLDARGRARMVDVGRKPATRRRALAEVRVRLGPEVLARLLSGDLGKGEALAVARIAGIQAAKRTSDWIPLCHDLPLDHVRIDFEPGPAAGTVRILCEAAATAPTGVEMEALTGAAAAALALYDMCKALERGIRVDGLRLLVKEGGRSGTWRAADAAAAPEGEEA